MKKLMMVMAVILISAGFLLGYNIPKPAFAEEVNLPNLLTKLPALNQSVIFSLDNSKFDYAPSVTLVQLWDKKISIDLGYSPSVEVLGLASFKLVEVKDYLDYPILKWVTIEPFIYAGVSRIENLKELGEYDYGVGVKVISIKF